jgi:predicted aconitase
MASRELFGAAAAAAGAITGAAAKGITTENADPIAHRSKREHHEARILNTFIVLSEQMVRLVRGGILR